MANDFRIGFGYDSHRFTEGDHLVIGGIVIPFHHCFQAHSDGDILIHAIVDALLGAAALKDIGTHFPDNDQALAGIDSKLILHETVALIHQKGWIINNVDASIIIEQPKLKPYIDTMTDTLSPILQIDRSALSLKAKTNEGMGFIGSHEGAAAFAVVSIMK